MTVWYEKTVQFAIIQPKQISLQIKEIIPKYSPKAIYRYRNFVQVLRPVEGTDAAPPVPSTRIDFRPLLLSRNHNMSPIDNDTKLMSGI